MGNASSTGQVIYSKTFQVDGQGYLIQYSHTWGSDTEGKHFLSLARYPGIIHSADGTTCSTTFLGGLPAAPPLKEGLITCTIGLYKQGEAEAVLSQTLQRATFAALGEALPRVLASYERMAPMAVAAPSAPLAAGSRQGGHFAGGLDERKKQWVLPTASVADA